MIKKEVLFALLAVFNLIRYTSQCPRIFSRREWHGREMGQNAKRPLLLPSFYLIIHQSSGPSCFNQTTCSIQMRNIQNFHIHSYDLTDIAYNFCIGQDGNVYEGRGWNVQGEDISGFSSHSLSICFIGTFDTEIPNFRAFLTAQELILCGINKGFISSSYALLAHRQVSSFNQNCPGNALYDEIKRNTRFQVDPKLIR